QGADGGGPGVPAGKIDANIDTLLAADPPSLPGKVVGAVVDHLIGAEQPQLFTLLVGSSAGNDTAPIGLDDLHGRRSHPAAGPQHQNQIVGLHVSVGEQHPIDGAVVRRNGGGIDKGQSGIKRNDVIRGNAAVFGESSL